MAANAAVAILLLILHLMHFFAHLSLSFPRIPVGLSFGKRMGVGLVASDDVPAILASRDHAAENVILIDKGMHYGTGHMHGNEKDEHRFNCSVHITCFGIDVESGGPREREQNKQKVETSMCRTGGKLQYGLHVRWQERRAVGPPKPNPVKHQNQDQASAQRMGNGARASRKAGQDARIFRLVEKFLHGFGGEELHSDEDNDQPMKCDLRSRISDW
jgi:hypothetical protein